MSLSRGSSFFASVGLGDGEAVGFCAAACFAKSSVLALLTNAIILPSGDHCGPPAPRATVVNWNESPPAIASMKSCGTSGRPSFSVTRTKTRNFPSGDQRGDESLGPAVSWCDSPVAGDTVQMAVLYPSFFSFTVTRTNATREPSG